MTITDEETLRACPFCGGEAKRFTIGNDEPNNAGGDCIGCTRCGASSHVEFGRKENLVSTWNTRSPVAVTDELEALKTAAEVLEAVAVSWILGEPLDEMVTEAHDTIMTLLEYRDAALSKVTVV